MKKIIYSVMMLATMAFTFTSCEDVPLPYGWPFANGGSDDPTETPVDAEGSGTADDPYNVAAALHLISTLGADVNSDNVYTKGVITSISEVSPSYGNATFKISDTADADNELTIYRAKYLDGANISSEDQIKIGDEVVIYGQLVNFRGNTPEYTQGCYIYSINGEGGGDEPDTPGVAKGSGTKDDPYNSVAANEYASKLESGAKSAEDVYIKGKVVSIREQYGTQYGNASFYISDDGTKSNQFYVFRALYLGNVKYTSGDLLKEGDEVVVCGKVTNYQGNTPETVQGEAYLYSLNSGSGGGGGDTPAPTEGKGDGTEGNPYNAAAANSVASALPSGGESAEVYVEGIISTIKEVSPSYGNATYYISDDGKAANEFYVFRGKYLNNEAFTSESQIKVGDKVLIYGKLLNYQGNTPEFAQGNYIVKLTPGSGGGSDTPGTGGEVSGNSITVTMADFGLANQAELTTLTLTDGTTLTFSTGEGSTSPKYYNTGGFNAARMYAKNTLTITGTKAITKVVITCTEPGNGSVYNGNDMMYGQAGGSKVTMKKDSDTQVTFSGFSNNTLFICNDHSEAKGGTQLRIQKLVITYAE